VSESTENKPVAPGDERLMHHSYDGIQEYDNPLPGWWKAIFIGSIFFAIGYWYYYHMGGGGKTTEENYAAQLAEYNAKRAEREVADAANVSEDKLTGAAHDAATVAKGKAIFAVKCVSCHTEDGHGLIGPNLTDLYQIHGSTRMDLYSTIKNGAKGTAMIAWGEQMPATDIVAAAAFVSTLRGKNVPGKPPEGNKVEPFAP
jgi:cytochrome c oxidase cbb3-type subunit 3